MSASVSPITIQLLPYITLDTAAAPEIRRDCKCISFIVFFKNQ
jgi:hypothetical protein